LNIEHGIVPIFIKDESGASVFAAQAIQYSMLDVGRSMFDVDLLTALNLTILLDKLSNLSPT
jgi:hypothetical protein